MTEQTPQPEVAGGGEELKGRPIPEVLEPSAEQKPSGQQVDIDALAAKLAEQVLPKLEEQARRRAQGIFDKTSYQFETMAEYLKAAGGDPKKAARDMALDQVAQRELARSEPEVPGRTEGEDSERRTAKFLNDLKDESGIELSDAELQATWQGKRYLSLEDAFKDVRKAAFKKAKQGSVGAGAVAAEGGGSASPAADVETVSSELSRLIASGASSADIAKKRDELREALSK